jgi:hypothetical protein
MKEALELLKDKITQMVFESDLDIFVKWLKSITKDASADNEVIVYQTLGGRSGGFDFRCDPCTKAAMIGFALSGILWTRTFPGLLIKVNAAWKKAKIKK